MRKFHTTWRLVHCMFDCLSCELQDEHLNDQSHVIGAEMSVYDFDYEDDGYAATGAYSAGNEVQSGARWIEGYSAPSQGSSSEAVPHSSGLKLKVSNKRIVRFVSTAMFFLVEVSVIFVLIYFLVLVLVFQLFFRFSFVLVFIIFSF